MHGICLQRDSSLLCSLAVTSVCCNHETRGHFVMNPQMLEVHDRLRTRRHMHLAHAAQKRGASLDRFIIENAAKPGMADRERAFVSGDQCRERKHARLGLGCRDQLVIGNMALQVMPAMCAVDVIEPQPLRLCHAPRRQPFTAHDIAMDLRDLEHEHRMPRPRHHRGKGSTSNATANDNQVRTCNAGHEATLCWGLRVIQRSVSPDAIPAPMSSRSLAEFNRGSD